MSWLDSILGPSRWRDNVDADLPVRQHVRILDGGAGAITDDPVNEETVIDLTLVSGSAPGGIDRSVQFNNGGVFSGASNVLYTAGGVLSVLGGLAVGTGTVATSGDLRAPASTTWRFRNAANSGDRAFFNINGSDIVSFGDVSGAGLTTVLIGSTLAFYDAQAATERGRFNTDGLTIAGSGKLTFGSSAATAGDIRIPSSFSGQFRNAANTGDRVFFAVDGADNVAFGDCGGAGLAAYFVGAPIIFFDQSATTERGRLDATGLKFAGSLTFGDDAATTGDVRIPDTVLWAYRNAADSADHGFFAVDGSDNTAFGDVLGVGLTTYLVGTTINFYDAAATTVRATIDSTGLAIGGTGVLVLGTSPATTGRIRLPNDEKIVWRNAANNANFIGLMVGSSNQLVLGGDDFGTAQTALTWICANTTIQFVLGGTTYAAFESGIMWLNATNAAIFGNGSTNFHSGQGILFLGDRSALPSADPTGGGYLYSDSGALKWRGSSGTITPIAPA